MRICELANTDIVAGPTIEISGDDSIDVTKNLFDPEEIPPRKLARVRTMR